VEPDPFGDKKIEEAEEEIPDTPIINPEIVVNKDVEEINVVMYASSVEPNLFPRAVEAGVVVIPLNITLELVEINESAS